MTGETRWLSNSSDGSEENCDVTSLNNEVAYTPRGPVTELLVSSNRERSADINKAAHEQGRHECREELSDVCDTSLQVDQTLTADSTTILQESSQEDRVLPDLPTDVCQQKEGKAEAEECVLDSGNRNVPQTTGVSESSLSISDRESLPTPSEDTSFSVAKTVSARSTSPAGLATARYCPGRAWTNKTVSDCSTLDNTREGNVTDESSAQSLSDSKGVLKNQEEPSGTASHQTTETAGNQPNVQPNNAPRHKYSDFSISFLLSQESSSLSRTKHRSSTDTQRRAPEDSGLATRYRGFSGDHGCGIPASSSSGDHDCGIPATSSSGDHGCGIPATSSSGDHGCGIPATSSSGDHGCGIPASSSSGDHGCGIPASSSSGDHGCGIPTTNSSGDHGCGIPASSSSGDHGCDIPATSSSGDHGCGIPASSSSGDHGCGIPATNSSGDHGCGIPASSSFGDHGCGIPATNSSGDHGCGIPATSSSGDHGCGILATSSSGGCPSQGLAETCSCKDRVCHKTTAATSTGDQAECHSTSSSSSHYTRRETRPVFLPGHPTTSQQDSGHHLDSSLTDSLDLSYETSFKQETTEGDDTGNTSRSLPPTSTGRQPSGSRVAETCDRIQSEHERTTDVPVGVATGKMSRYKYTEAHLIYLRKEFDKNRYPSYDDLLKMSENIQVPVRQLQVWFQNKRASTTGTRRPKTRRADDDVKREIHSKRSTSGTLSPSQPCLAAPRVCSDLTQATALHNYQNYQHFLRSQAHLGLGAPSLDPTQPGHVFPLPYSSAHAYTGPTFHPVGFQSHLAPIYGQSSSFPLGYPGMGYLQWLPSYMAQIGAQATGSALPPAFSQVLGLLGSPSAQLSAQPSAQLGAQIGAPVAIPCRPRPSDVSSSLHQSTSTNQNGNYRLP